MASTRAMPYRHTGSLGYRILMISRRYLLRHLVPRRNTWGHPEGTIRSKSSLLAKGFLFTFNWLKYFLDVRVKHVLSQGRGFEFFLDISSATTTTSLAFLMLVPGSHCSRFSITRRLGGHTSLCISSRSRWVSIPLRGCLIKESCLLQSI